VVLHELSRWIFESSLRADNLGLYRANITAVTHFPELAAEIHRFRLMSASPLTDYLQFLAERGAIDAQEIPEAARRFGVLSMDGMRYLMGFPAASAAEKDRLAARNMALFLAGAGALEAGASEFDAPGVFLSEPRPALPALRLPQLRMDELLDAARREFLENGFGRGSIDSIAAATGIGKMTIYRHFSDKNGLFEAAMLAGLARLGPIDLNVAARDSESALTEMATRILQRFIEPECLMLHRVMIGEAQRFPLLARRLYDAFTGAATLSIAKALQASRLRIAAPAAAARQFFILALNGNRLLTDAQLPGATARSKIAEEAVRMFIRGSVKRKLSAAARNSAGPQGRVSPIRRALI
jgi:AcrR family transcriptional regulator